MTIVSTFELLVKPIAPRDPLPTEFRGVARRVIQGYFLTITNLSDRDLRFRFRFTASSTGGAAITGGATQFPFFGTNTDLIYDIAGDENLEASRASIFSGPPGTTAIRGDIPSLRAQQTANIKLLPRLVPPIGSPSILEQQDPEFEIRGFAEVLIPTNDRFEPGVGIVSTPQTEESVPVLLQPEIRGTFLPNNLSSDNLDFDQINYPLTTANGQAFAEIEPSLSRNPAPVTPEVLNSVVNELRSNPSILENSSDDQVNQLRDLVTNLFRVDPNADNLTRISNALNELGIPIIMRPTNE